MVRIKKENYIKIQEKRKQQIKMEQRINHLKNWQEVYLEDVLKQCFINPITDILDKYELLDEILSKEPHMLCNNIAGLDTPTMMCFCNAFVEFLGIYKHHDDFLDLPEFFATCYFDKFNDAIFEGMQLFFNNEPEINSLFIDLSDKSFNNKFYIFEIFEKARNVDIIFIKNLDYNLFQFLIDYGIENCCSYICFFFINDTELSKIEKNFQLSSGGIVLNKDGNKTADLKPKAEWSKEEDELALENS